MCFKSLYDVYICKKGWKSYYDITIEPSKLFSYSLDLNEGCRSFIEKHFEKGNKESVFNIKFLDDYKKNGKHEHTVALYLLGLLLKDVFYYKIKSDIDGLGINKEKWYQEREFMYTWYLTCLYHDVASCVEDIRGQKIPCCDNCILEMKNPYSYQPKIAEEKIVRTSEELVKNYCNYRISNGKRDHGIYGGILLFDRLLKNFEKKTKDHSWEAESKCIRDNVMWRQEHIDHFAYVSDAIICHNMWTVQANDSEDAEKYIKYRLEELIIKSDEDKLSIKAYPLQFMLCLLDTIEPVKRFSALTAKKVLENVSIEQSAGNKIRIAWKDLIKQQKEFWDWIRNISGMSEWMQVEVSPCNKEGDWCYVTITFDNSSDKSQF